MIGPRILLADNNATYLEEMSALLQREGYYVETASGPSDARRILDSGLVAMAIIDLRLIDDLDRRDVSGLELAKETNLSIPKIILTAYRPDDSLLLEALQPGAEGLSPAVRFVLKSRGETAVLKAVRETIRLPRFRQGLDELWDYIFRSHEAAQEQAKSYFRLSLAVGAIGALIIFLGFAFVLVNRVSPAIYAAALGVLTEAAGFLIYQQAKAANTRADNFHEKLLVMRYIENLLQACQEYQVANDVRADVIRSAASYWLGEPAVIGLASH